MKPYGYKLAHVKVVDDLVEVVADTATLSFSHPLVKKIINLTDEDASIVLAKNGHKSLPIRVTRKGDILFFTDLENINLYCSAKEFTQPPTFAEVLENCSCGATGGGAIASTAMPLKKKGGKKSKKAPDTIFISRF